MNRRDFLGRSGQAALGAAAGLTLLANAQSVRAAPANERISLAIVGVGCRGRDLMSGFLQRPDCRITYLCDPDSSMLALGAKLAAERQNVPEPKCIQDFRQALDDKVVDAIVVATPDHWHCLAGVWGCQAGKDVYVEKPLSHNCWEGRKLVEAARKYRRIVQVGMQNRSAPYLIEAKRYIDAGKLGRIHLVRVYNQHSKQNFPRQLDGEPPQGFDWDLWNGPAPQARYNPSLRNWYGWWRYSGGDMANNGVHHLDIARWLCGVDYPNAVHCSGGRFDSDGADETPDTQVAVFDFDKLVMTFELTLYAPYMMKVSPAVRQSRTEYPYWPQCGTRIEVFGSEQLMVVGPMGGGWQVYDRTKAGKSVIKAQRKGLFPDPEHKEDFAQCLRSRKLPNADIEEGHRSALMVHYANISYRLGGRTLTIDPQSEQIRDDTKAMELFKRTGRTPWAIPAKV
jgi:predicted dehydrogenase